jgi:hypothetical protein
MAAFMALVAAALMVGWSWLMLVWSDGWRPWMIPGRRCRISASMRSAA